MFPLPDKVDLSARPTLSRPRAAGRKPRKDNGDDDNAASSRPLSPLSPFPSLYYLPAIVSLPPLPPPSQTPARLENWKLHKESLCLEEDYLQEPSRSAHVDESDYVAIVPNEAMVLGAPDDVYSGDGNGGNAKPDETRTERLRRTLAGPGRGKEELKQGMSLHETWPCAREGWRQHATAVLDQPGLLMMHAQLQDDSLAAIRLQFMEAAYWYGGQGSWEYRKAMHRYSEATRSGRGDPRRRGRRRRLLGRSGSSKCDPRFDGMDRTFAPIYSVDPGPVNPRKRKEPSYRKTG